MLHAVYAVDGLFPPFLDAIGGAWVPFPSGSRVARLTFFPFLHRYSFPSFFVLEAWIFPYIVFPLFFVFFAPPIPSSPAHTLFFFFTSVLTSFLQALFAQRVCYPGCTSAASSFSSLVLNFLLGFSLTVLYFPPPSRFLRSPSIYFVTVAFIAGLFPPLPLDWLHGGIPLSFSFFRCKDGVFSGKRHAF